MISEGLMGAARKLTRTCLPVGGGTSTFRSKTTSRGSPCCSNASCKLVSVLGIALGCRVTPGKGPVYIQPFALWENRGVPVMRYGWVLLPGRFPKFVYDETRTFQPSCHENGWFKWKIDSCFLSVVISREIPLKV